MFAYFLCQVQNLRSMVCVLALKCLADMYRYIKRDMVGVRIRRIIFSTYYTHCIDVYAVFTVFGCHVRIQSTMTFVIFNIYVYYMLNERRQRKCSIWKAECTVKLLINAPGVYSNNRQIPLAFNMESRCARVVVVRVESN